METKDNLYGPGSPLGGNGQSVKDTARETTEKARSRVRSFAETGREELADQIGGFGRVLRDMGSKLREDENEQAAHYTELIGDRVDRVSRYLAEHDTNDLIGEVEDLAREHPLAFLGGCVGIGIAIGRFFKASAPEREEMPLGVAGEPVAREVPITEPVEVTRTPVGVTGVTSEPAVTLEEPPVTTPMSEVRPLDTDEEER